MSAKTADGTARKLEAKVFVVVVTTSQATRWLEHDDVLLRGMEARARLYFEHLTEGQLPGVQVLTGAAGALFLSSSGENTPLKKGGAV